MVQIYVPAQIYGGSAGQTCHTAFEYRCRVKGQDQGQVSDLCQGQHLTGTMVRIAQQPDENFFSAVDVKLFRSVVVPDSTNVHAFCPFPFAATAMTLLPAQSSLTVRSPQGRHTHPCH